MSRGLSSVVVGLMLALAMAGTLVAVVRWSREQTSRMPTKVAERVAVASYRACGDLVVVNYGFRAYTIKLVNEDESLCGNPWLSSCSPGEW